MNYRGDFYEAIGDFLGANYLRYGFTRGTNGEVDFLIDLLALPAGARILDVGCGAGRHSLELARRGFRPIGVDISQGLIDVARRAAADEGLAAEFIVSDARHMSFDREFDAAICLCEGAFGLAGDQAGHRAILAAIARALRPGAPFVLTAIHALSAVRNLEPGAIFDACTATVLRKETITSPSGESRVVDLYTTAFTCRELTMMLENAGFTVEAVHGCEAGEFARKPLTCDDIEIMMVSRRLP
jgi:ubiquinone/menaquinone biosynthesis C-methylase UbiE